MKKLKLLGLAALTLSGCIGCGTKEPSTLQTFTETLTVEDNCILNLYYNIFGGGSILKQYYLSEKTEEEYRYDKVEYTYNADFTYLDIVSYPLNKEKEHLTFHGHTFAIMVHYYKN